MPKALQELLHTHIHIIIRFVPGRIESSNSMADGAGHFISEGVYGKIIMRDSISAGDRHMLTYWYFKNNPHRVQAHTTHIVP